MDKLIEQISHDLNIPMFNGEGDDGFCERILYSSFGIWCLNYASRSIENQEGISKNALTRKLTSLIDSYLNIFPNTKEYFKVADTVGIHIRQIYEELGYLILEDQRLKVAPYGRGVELNNEHYLFYGLKDKFEYISGLAVITSIAKYKDTVTNVLVRDEVNPMAFVKANYDPILFNKWNLSIEGLSFFDPLRSSNISNSWNSEPTTELSIAKNEQLNLFYRVICKEGKILYYLTEKSDNDKDSIFGYDYRRLYYSLKYFYGNPFQVKVSRIDSNYIKINAYGRFPNREQYFLSLIGWAANEFDNRDIYIVRKDFYEIIKQLLLSIGVTIVEVNT